MGSIGKVLGFFPTSTYRSDNYWVDAVVESPVISGAPALRVGFSKIVATRVDLYDRNHPTSRNTSRRGAPRMTTMTLYLG